MIIHLEKAEDFEKEISQGLVLVDFYADWCGPCSMLAPIIEELDNQMSIKVVKINTDFVPDIARIFRIMSIPTLLLFEDGKLINKTMGYMPLEALKKFVSKS